MEVFGTSRVIILVILWSGMSLVVWIFWIYENEQLIPVDAAAVVFIAGAVAFMTTKGNWMTW